MARFERGFTLLEIIFAVAVLGIAMGALMQSLGQSTKNSSYFRDKTIAHWVASNVVVEQQSNGKYPGIGKLEGKEDMAGHEWYWSVQVNDSGVPDVRQLEVEVRRDRQQKQAMAYLLALVGKP
ncbi:MAG: type II secretion system minor pseudopilin GspI [Gammaproteobacteria bacterium]|nr:type II secretion system minor pseudopilin GspI [Gammaproteobacteria bacterium]